LFESALTAFDVVVTVESSTRTELNVELVETCTLYEAAPDEAFHDKVSDVG
jgi:hypothetical protein